MRVLFVTSAYPATATDARGVFVHRMARSLVQEGVDVTVLAPDLATGSEPAVEGVKVVRARYWGRQGQTLAAGLGGIVPNLSDHPTEVVKLPPLVASLTWRTRQLAHEADLVHAHWVYPGGVAGRLAGGDHPLVVTAHGGDLNLARSVLALRLASAWVAKRADRCIGVSRELCDDFVRLGVRRDRVVYIPYGVDRPELSAVRSPDDTLRVVYVGSLIPRKSVSTLVEAHRLLRGRGVSIETVIVGAGPEMDHLRAMAGHPDGAGIRFEGQKGTSEIQGFLNWSDALVLPSLSEGRPNVVLEAMATGRAVVATDIPGTRSLIRPEETGLLFPAGDSTALAQRLERLARNPEVCEAMGMQGRAAVDEERLWSADIARRHIELYEETLRGRRG